MNWLCLSDLHYKVANRPDTDDAERQVLSILDAHPEIDAVCNLGDSLDTHDKVITSVKERCLRFLEALGRRKPVYVLIGNHDYSDNTQFLTTHHCFHRVTIPNVTFIDTPTRVNEWILVPYVPNGRFVEAVRSCTSIDVDTPQLLMAHQEFTGAKLGGLVSEAEAVPEKWVIVSGHIHERERVGRNLFYIGAWMAHTVADRKSKGVLLLHKTAMEYVPISLPRKKTAEIWSLEDELPDPIAELRYVSFHGTREEYRVFSKRYPGLKVVWKPIPKTDTDEKDTDEKDTETKRETRSYRDVLFHHLQGKEHAEALLERYKTFFEE